MKYNIPFVDLGQQYKNLKSKILPKIDSILSAGELILKGEVQEFERKLAEYVGTKYAIGVNSCTDALFLSLKAAGVGPGDEVITVSHTFVATIEAIVHTGAQPVLVDINDDYLMDMDELEDVITSKTKAIIPVHLSGDMCDMQRIKEIVASFPTEIIIIEDAAQALGSEQNGAKAGSIGLAGCFSFYPAKILGACGDAGAVTTNNKELADKIRALRSHSLIGKNLDVADESMTFGFNSRLDDLQAAILNIKIEELDTYLNKRRQIARIYDGGLSGIEGIVLPRMRDVYQDYVIRAKDRNALSEHLAGLGIAVHRLGLFGPIPNHSYKGLGLIYSLPKTEKYIDEWLRIPCNPEMLERDAYDVVAEIKQFYAK